MTQQEMETAEESACDALYAHTTECAKAQTGTGCWTCDKLMAVVVSSGEALEAAGFQSAW